MSTTSTGMNYLKKRYGQKDTNMRVTDKHVCFWNEWPSNWHPAEFDLEVNGTLCHFYNTEQYFMYMKAIIFGDEEIANQILQDGSPTDIRGLRS